MNTETAIKRFIVEEIMLGNAQTRIETDQSLLTSGILDSLALIRLINFLEEKFNVVIEDEDIVPDNFETIEALKIFLEDKVSG
jgi:acyl carrier protein